MLNERQLYAVPGACRCFAPGLVGGAEGEIEMVYHPGRVLKVFPSHGKETDTAATIRFWDSNLHTVKVHNGIAEKLREGNMVLVDYYPLSERLNRPKMVAMSIVDKKDETELWDHYQEFLDMRKKAILAKRKAEGAQIPPPSNIGVG